MGIMQLGNFCLSGCFSRALHVVFAPKFANEGPKLDCDGSHAARSPRRPSSPGLELDPPTSLNRGYETPMAWRDASPPTLLTTRSSSLLKQPDKQKLTRALTNGRIRTQTAASDGAEQVRVQNFSRIQDRRPRTLYGRPRIERENWANDSTNKSIPHVL